MRLQAPSKKAGKKASGATAALPVGVGAQKSGAGKGGGFARVRSRALDALARGRSIRGGISTDVSGSAQADWKDSFKKKQVGVADMTLLSTISNESINENLKKRFQNQEIYVRGLVLSG